MRHRQQGRQAAEAVRRGAAAGGRAGAEGPPISEYLFILVVDRRAGGAGEPAADDLRSTDANSYHRLYSEVTSFRLCITVIVLM